MRAVDDERAWIEIAGSPDIVGRELGREPRLFCYPGGYVTARDIALVERAGYFGAVTTEEGVNRPDHDNFTLSRTQIDRYHFDWVFRARLAGATVRSRRHHRPTTARRLTHAPRADRKIGGLWSS